MLTGVDKVLLANEEACTEDPTSDVVIGVKADTEPVATLDIAEESTTDEATEASEDITDEKSVLRGMATLLDGVEETGVITAEDTTLDSMLETGTGVGVSVADGITLEISDAAALEAMLETSETEVDAALAIDDTKLPASVVMADTSLDESETAEDSPLESGRTAVGVVSGELVGADPASEVVTGTGAVSVTPVPVPLTPDEGSTPSAVDTGVSLGVGDGSIIDETSDKRDDTIEGIIAGSEGVGVARAEDGVSTAPDEVGKIAVSLVPMAVVSPTMIPVGVEVASGIEVSVALVGTTMLDGKPPVDPKSAVLDGITIELGTPPVEPTSSVDEGSTMLEERSPVEPIEDAGRTIDDGSPSVVPGNEVGTTMEDGRTIDDGRPPVEPAPVSTDDVGRMIEVGMPPVEPVSEDVGRTVDDRIPASKFENRLESEELD